MKPSRLAVAALLLCASGLSCAADANPKVLSAAEGYRGDALQLLERLVNIDSGTGNEAGLGQIGTIVTDELRKAGAQVETVSAAPAVGNNIVATWKGTGKTRILLMAHMDTVFKDGTARAKPFYIKDKRAYGPGVMDDKGGVVAGLYAMKILQQLDFKQYGQVTLLLNTNEETGSKGTRALIEREAKQHDVTLNLEPGRPADGLVVWRKGSGTAEIDVKGKAAHAGVAPETGRNAANELAHQVLQVGKLGDSTKQTTFNVTVLKAGDATNVIPDRCVVTVNYRYAPSLSPSQAEEHVRAVFDGFEVEVTDNAGGARPGLHLPAAQAFVEALGVSVEAKQGWTDVARFSAMGVPAVNFGPGDPNLAHMDDERAPVSDYVECEAALLRWLS